MPNGNGWTWETHAAKVEAVDSADVSCPCFVIKQDQISNLPISDVLDKPIAKLSR